MAGLSIFQAGFTPVTPPTDFMKKKLLIIGLALAGVINLPAQVVVTPAANTASVNFTLDPTTAGSLMQYATVRQARLIAQGTNTIIVGQAVLVVPTATLFGVVNSSNVPPTGYDLTNFASGNVSRRTNGFVGTVTFSKPAQ